MLPPGHSCFRAHARVQRPALGGSGNRVMVQFQDQSLRCVDCGQEFIFTASEQQFYKDKGLTNAPTRCRACRDARKAQRAGGGSGGSHSGGGGGYGGKGRGAGSGTMYTTVCSNCGNETQVPFQPTPGRAVFCRDCFQAQKRSGGGGNPGG